VAKTIEQLRQSEQDAIRDYERAAQATGARQQKQLFRHIENEEREHKRELTALARKRKSAFYGE
jgi:rubrerythrin